ncbi:MAG: hypothetical protein ABSG55_09485 [Dehalococcoidia bacterium]
MAHSATYPLQGASAVSVTAPAGVCARDRAVALLPLRALPLGEGSLARGTLILGEPALLALS